MILEVFIPQVGMISALVYAATATVGGIGPAIFGRHWERWRKLVKLTFSVSLGLLIAVTVDDVEPVVGILGGLCPPVAHQFLRGAQWAKKGPS